jgi:hypothetical protein
MITHFLLISSTLRQEISPHDIALFMSEVAEDDKINSKKFTNKICNN